MSPAEAIEGPGNPPGTSLVPLGARDPLGVLPPMAERQPVEHGSSLAVSCERLREAGAAKPPNAE